MLGLKENPGRNLVLVGADQLREELIATDPDESFGLDEMMTAVGHLENHGYAAVLISSAGPQFILLLPTLLPELASSIILQADKNPRDLGALSETVLLRGGYQFPELTGLGKAEQEVLLDAMVVRFLRHNVCFRETLGADTLLIFPGLIKQKRPLRDEVETFDDVSYVIRGRVENIYSAIAVLLGYTPTFARVSQWQNQAQYEFAPGQVCGFRMQQEREGEVELLLYYKPGHPGLRPESVPGAVREVPVRTRRGGHAVRPGHLPGRAPAGARHCRAAQAGRQGVRLLRGVRPEGRAGQYRRAAVPGLERIPSGPA